MYTPLGDLKKSWTDSCCDGANPIDATDDKNVNAQDDFKMV